MQVDEPWQVPEAWAGGIDTARILFLSSNPSISEDDGGEPGEDFPLSSWSDEDIAKFMMRRFDPAEGFVRDDHFRRRNGEYSKRRVRFWTLIRARAEELLGEGADPNVDFVMTEVVHCKSRSEKGVTKATRTCSDLYLKRIFEVCPANVVVIVGARARDQASAMFQLPDDFGRKSTVGVDEAANLAVREIGGRERLIAYLWHPTGMTGPKRFSRSYPTKLEAIRRVARRIDDPSTARTA